MSRKLNPKGTLWGAPGTPFGKHLGAKFEDLFQAGSQDPLWEPFGIIFGPFWEHFWYNFGTSLGWFLDI